VPKLLTVNILGKDRKTFKSVKIGTDSAEYSISSNTCTGSQRGPSQCSIYVAFTPNHGGTRSGTLNLSDTSGNQVINLTGTGEGVELSATFLGFGKVKVGSTNVAENTYRPSPGKSFGTFFKMVRTPAITACSQTLAAGRPFRRGATVKSLWYSNHCISEAGLPTSRCRIMMVRRRSSSSSPIRGSSWNRNERLNNQRHLALLRGGAPENPAHGVFCECRKRGSHHLLHLPALQPGMENPHPLPIYTSSLMSPMSTHVARLLTLHPIRIIIQQPRATPPPCEIIT